MPYFCWFGIVEPNPITTRTVLDALCGLDLYRDQFEWPAADLLAGSGTQLIVTIRRVMISLGSLPSPVPARHHGRY